MEGRAYNHRDHRNGGGGGGGGRQRDTPLYMKAATSDECDHYSHGVCPIRLPPGGNRCYTAFIVLCTITIIIKIDIMRILLLIR